MAAPGVCAADWQWPAQMALGGFALTGVSGSVKADGSGGATGTLQIPNLGNTAIKLTRSARGEIAGRASINTRLVRGDFTLSNNGLRGSGTIDCSPRWIGSSAISISPQGETSGNGRMDLGRLSATVDFSASNSSCSVSGSAPVSAKIDTSVATYKFDGRLVLVGGSGRMSGTLSGRVERTSKLASQVTTFNIPNTSVDMSNGQCSINVGGVSVTFAVF